jgi:hypothetical protein
VYSARCRAEEALKLWEFLRPMTCVSAKGYELLRFLFTQDADYLSLNLGLPECQYALEADMIEILRQRPELPDPAPERRVREPEGDPAMFLGPVQMDWAATLLRGEDAAFKNLAARQPPFYRARGFLEDG